MYAHSPIVEINSLSEGDNILWISLCVVVYHIHGGSTLSVNC